MTDVRVIKKKPGGDSRIALARLERLRDQLMAERRNRHLSQQYIADQIGCSRSAIADFERNPSATSVLTVFAYAAAVSIELIFVEEEIGLVAGNMDLEEIPGWGEIT